MKLKMRKAFNFYMPGEVIETGAGVGQIMVQRGIAVEVRDSEPEQAARPGKRRRRRKVKHADA